MTDHTVFNSHGTDDYRILSVATDEEGDAGK